MTDRRFQFETALCSRIIISLAALIWIGGIGYGVGKVHSFESTPGDIGQTPPIWPIESKISPEIGRSILVMLIHPECSCSRASLDELAQVMERSQGRVAAWVLFVDTDASSRATSWAQAENIPGVHVDVDPKGAEAVRFGALTSGYVAMYDPSGHLLFSGGITGARGHEGKNMGRDRLIASIAGSAKGSAVHSVFGCALMGSGGAAANTPVVALAPTRL